MNIVTDLIERIEARRIENKNPCKSYATEAKATAQAETLAIKYAKHFTLPGNTIVPCRYVVAYNQAWGRWVVGFDFSQLISRNTSTGGYLGIASQDGFFTY